MCVQTFIFFMAFIISPLLIVPSPFSSISLNMVSKSDGGHNDDDDDDDDGDGDGD
jgi:hypothetical protein